MFITCIRISRTKMPAVKVVLHGQVRSSEELFCELRAVPGASLKSHSSCFGHFFFLRNILLLIKVCVMNIKPELTLSQPSGTNSRRNIAHTLKQTPQKTFLPWLFSPLTLCCHLSVNLCVWDLQTCCDNQFETN